MQTWEASLRAYCGTKWEEGGPGECSLVSEIRLAIREIERLRAMMRQLVFAPLGAPEWHTAMDAIGYDVTETDEAAED